MRDVFVDYVKNGGEKFCSPQIGAGADFDTKLAGKEWISETTLDDTINAIEMFDIVPLVNVGCPYESCVKEFMRKEKMVENGKDRRRKEFSLKTSAGNLVRKTCEIRRNSPFDIKYPVTCEEDLDTFGYYIRELMDAEFSMV